MQDIVFYAAANETLGVVRDYANARKMPTPVLTLGVSVCLRMRLFSALDTAEPYPVAAFDDITDWQWRMDGDFDRDTTCKLVADANGISVHCVTDTINGETMDFTEFVIPISNMNTQELAAWLGNEPKRTGLTGELVGYDSEEHAVFVLQIDNFTVRNRVAGLGTPTAVDQEIVTRTTAEHMIRTAVSAMGNTKQDKLTSSNAGSGISIAGDGVISTENVPQGAISGLSASLAAKQDKLTAGYRMELIGGSTVGQKRYFQIETPTGSSITLLAGHAYRINATTGQKTLNVEAMNPNEIGLDGHLELFLANMGYIQTGPNVVLANALEPDAVNNCTVRFHDDLAIISVEDHVAGYIVVNATASDDGSLACGLNTSTNEYIAFDASLNGTTVPLAGATANGEKHIVGNGYTETAITGAVDCGTSKFTIANLSLSDVQVVGGTMTFGDAFIPSGSTVAVSGGGLAIEKVTGAGEGSMIDLGNFTHSLKVNAASFAKNCSFQFNVGTFQTAAGGASDLNFEGCSFSKSGTGNYVIYMRNNGTLSIRDCAFPGSRTGIFCAGSSSVRINVGGSNVINRIYMGGAGKGDVFISSGAIVDLTGNTNTAPIAPGGGITFEQGGATVYPSAGQASAYILGGMTVPKLGNTNDIDLGGTNVNISSGATASASGCTFTSGWGGGDTNGGAFYVSNGGSLDIVECTISGCTAFRGGAIAASYASISISSSVISGNEGRGDVYLYGGAGAVEGSTIGNAVLDLSCALELRGVNRIDDVSALSQNPGRNGSVTISSGAVVDLTGNTNTTPINPGGGITICGGPMNSGTKIIGSAGAATQMREFEDVEIHGTSITKQGIIYGATVTIPDSRIYHVRYTLNGGTISSVTITGPTVYVLTDEISSQAGLTGVVNI